MGMKKCLEETFSSNVAFLAYYDTGFVVSDREMRFYEKIRRKQVGGFFCSRTAVSQ